MALAQKSFFELFPTPDYLLLSNVGLALSDDAVRYVELRHALFGQGATLKAFEKISLPEGVVRAGFIEEPDKLISILKSLAQRHDIKYIHATLPEERAYLFSASIARVPKEGLRDAVAFILEENVPVTLDNAVFDFEVIEDRIESPEIKVLVSVLSKKVVDFYIEVFNRAGLMPVSFEIESQAIARAVTKGDKSSELIINLSKKKTAFYIVDEGVVQFTTTLPYGLGENARAHLNDLKAEMRKIFAFWNSKNSISITEEKIKSATLTGSEASHKNLVDELMSDCPASYNLANVWTNAPMAYGSIPRELGEDLDYAPAIGLALPNIN